MSHQRLHRGFTLIELIVVLAIVALLVSIAAPRYNRSVDAAKEAALKTSLNVMRDAIDKFVSDRGRYPNDLDELVTLGYLRKIPEDPLTQRVDSWVPQAPSADSLIPGALGDVRTSAPGHAMDGSEFSTW